MKQEKQLLPLLPLKDAVLLPHSIAPIFVGRDLSLKAVEYALNDSKHVIVTMQKNRNIESPHHHDLHAVGVEATILQVMRMPNGSLKILVEGLHRVIIDSVEQQDDFLVVSYKPFQDISRHDTTEIQALWRNFINIYKKYATVNPKIPLPNELITPTKSIDTIAIAIDTLAIHCNLSIEERQTILESTHLQQRLLLLCSFLQKEIEIIETERRISTNVQTQVEKNQREYYLHEQIKAINKELGRDDQNDDIVNLQNKANALTLSSEASEKISFELKRLEQIPPFSPEAAVSRNYIDWILALPWNTESKDRISLEQAEKILDSEHAGLKKAKERILEFVAAKKFNPLIQHAPIICLVGPPGVGKTSIARSIAKALGREFIRIALGGVRDEAEIRGHRRTYIGALPGKFIQALRKAKTKNPVILLDEIDKMSTDHHGDPSSALLEVLDPEQNHNFCDNYLEIGYDLSKVMFIATANHPDGIPYPLMDRMELIFLSGYTEEEKLEIAQKFLIPKNLKDHGITATRCRFPKEVIQHIISHYTKEAGVRQLERTIAKLIRKAIQILITKKHQERFTQSIDRCLEWLGPAHYKRKNFEKETASIGCVTGLAWTELGGDILEIETTAVPGKGELTLTGQLGDVMQESAQAALSYIRSQADHFGIKKSFFSSHDIHVHVPEGATPKDGPSAGIGICTAMISTLTATQINPVLAMTGEITLRGRVLPVGGLKEKILAAQQHGIHTVILPEENKEEVLKIQKDMKQAITIHFVSHIDEVLGLALKKPSFKNKKTTSKKVITKKPITKQQQVIPARHAKSK